MEWLRWQVALLFNRYRDTCWAELVLWAVNPEFHPWREILDLRYSAGRCFHSGDYPYCGKCWSTGLHVELGGKSYEEELADYAAKEA